MMPYEFIKTDTDDIMFRSPQTLLEDDDAMTTTSADTWLHAACRLAPMEISYVSTTAWFRDGTHLRRWKSLRIPNFDISIAAEIILLPVSRNKCHGGYTFRCTAGARTKNF